MYGEGPRCKRDQKMDSCGGGYSWGDDDKNCKNLNVIFFEHLKQYKTDGNF